MRILRDRSRVEIQSKEVDSMSKIKRVTMDKDKVDALVSDNIRMRSAINRVWFKPWFPVALIVATSAAAFAGAHWAVQA